MTDWLTHLVVWLNAGANALGGTVLAPIAVVPGWLSATVVAAASGVLLLVVFKYTSDQRAVRRARDDVNAHLLALKLFTDSPAVALRTQGRILLGSLRLLALAAVPVLVMAVPVSLLLAQLGLWYEVRPLRVGEDAVVTVRLNGPARPDVRLEPTDAAEVPIGPVRVDSRREVCWNVAARQNGYHRLAFRVGDQTAEKELAVGDGFLRVSVRRPGWDWADALAHPCEPPFGPDSPVQSITIDYPERAGWASGSGTWLLYWFAGSLISGLCFRRFLNVNV